MEQTKTLLEELAAQKHQERLAEIYVDSSVLPYQTARYQKAIQKFEAEIYSAAGRSEVGGNHTDHQHGEVLAASINLDAIAIVRKSNKSQIQLLSDGYPMITADLSSLEKKIE